jgi:hypothetical protein
MEIGYLVGDPEEVDLTTLNKPGPVRIKIACVDVTKVRGESRVFFNGESYNIRWEVEGTQQENSKNNSKFDWQWEEENEDEEKEEGEFGNDKNIGSFTQKEGGGDTSMNKWGQKAGGDSSNKYQKRMKRDQQGGFGIIEEKGGVEHMEIDKEPGEKAVEEVEEINESGRKTITTMQEEDILTQQSAVALNTEEGGAVEEQLLDYDEDPLVAEKLAMVELEKKVELRANKLVKESAIIIQNEK